MAPRIRRPSASQPNHGDGFSKLLPVLSNEIGVMEGVLAMREEEEDEKEKEGSAEGKEGPPEPEWTYPDGGLRAWLVVFVSNVVYLYRVVPLLFPLHVIIFGDRRAAGALRPHNSVQAWFGAFSCSICTKTCILRPNCPSS